MLHVYSEEEKPEEIKVKVFETRELPSSMNCSVCDSLEKPNTSLFQRWKPSSCKLPLGRSDEREMDSQKRDL